MAAKKKTKVTKLRGKFTVQAKTVWDAKFFPTGRTFSTVSAAKTHAAKFLANNPGTVCVMRGKEKVVCQKRARRFEEADY